MRSSTQRRTPVPGALGPVAGRRVRFERLVLPPDRRFAQVLGLIQLAILLFAVVVLFQLVTLPVEFDASRRRAGR